MAHKLKLMISKVQGVPKIISRHYKVFSSIGVGGGSLGTWGAPPQTPPVANIKCVAANIMRGAAIILHGPAIILRGMTSICSNVHDILQFQHQFFEILGFSKGKIHFFPKVLKNWSSCQKTGYPFIFLGGGSDMDSQ